MKEESSTRTSLEIEVPAEEVEKTFSDVTRAYAKRAAIPGFRKGHAPESVVQKRFGEQIREDVLEALLPDALAAAVEEKQPRGARPAAHRGAGLGSRPAPIRFTARLDLKPAIDPGEYRGIPVEDVSVEPTDEEIARVVDRLREGHAEFHPIEGRAAAPGDFAVADVAGSFVEILAPGQNPRTFRDEKITLEVGHADSMPEINEALRGALPGETQRLPQDLSRRLPQRGVPRQDRGLRADARRAEGEAAAGGQRRRSRGRSARARPSRRLREKIRQGLRQEKEAERRRKFRRAILDTLLSRGADPGAGGPRRVGDRGRAPRLRALPGRQRHGPEGGRLGAAAPGGAARGREAGAGVPAARRDRGREAIEVTDTELEAEFKRTAARRGVDPAALREQLAKSGRPRRAPGRDAPVQDRWTS